MLYDTRWDAKTKADPLTIEALIAWLEKQPADEMYCYGDNCRCLLGRYLGEEFEGEANVGTTDFNIYRGRVSHINDCALPDGWDKLAQAQPHTFGAALDRARALARAY